MSFCFLFFVFHASANAFGFGKPQKAPRLGFKNSSNVLSTVRRPATLREGANELSDSHCTEPPTTQPTQALLKLELRNSRLVDHGGLFGQPYLLHHFQTVSNRTAYSSNYTSCLLCFRLIVVKQSPIPYYRTFSKAGYIIAISNQHHYQGSRFVLSDIMLSYANRASKSFMSHGDIRQRSTNVICSYFVSGFQGKASPWSLITGNDNHVQHQPQLRLKHSERQIKRLFKNHPAKLRVEARLGVDRSPEPLDPPQFPPVFEPVFLPNGWSAQPGPEVSVPEYPFQVKRTKNKPNDAVGFLPVYSNFR